MKLNVKEIQTYLAPLKKCCNKTAPYIEVESCQKGFYLLTSNGDTQMEVLLPHTKKHTNFKTCIELDKLNKLGKIAKKKKQDLEFGSTIDYQSSFHVGKTTFYAKTAPEEVIQRIQFGESKVEFQIPAYQLKLALTKTLPSVSDEETRYYLGGVYLELDKNFNVLCTATDGHRLAQYQISEAQSNSADFKGIVPSEILRRLLEVISKKSSAKVAAPGEVAFSIDSAKRVKVQYEEVTLTSQLVEGSFPDYWRVIPESPNMKFVASREELVSELESGSMFRGKKYELGVRTDLFPNKAVFSTHCSQEGGLIFRSEVSGETTILLEDDDPKDKKEDKLSIGFNFIYLLEALKSMESENVELSFTNGLSPILIQPKKEEELISSDEKELYIVMPMRL